MKMRFARRVKNAPCRVSSDAKSRSQGRYNHTCNFPNPSSIILSHILSTSRFVFLSTILLRRAVPFTLKAQPWVPPLYARLPSQGKGGRVGSERRQFGTSTYELHLVTPQILTAVPRLVYPVQKGKLLYRLLKP